MDDDGDYDFDIEEDNLFGSSDKEEKGSDEDSDDDDEIFMEEDEEKISINKESNKNLYGQKSSKKIVRRKTPVVKETVISEKEISPKEVTIYERTRLIGARAIQLSNGAVSYLPTEIFNGTINDLNEFMDSLSNLDLNSKPSKTTWIIENGNLANNLVQSTVKIATLEFELGLIPLKIRRKYPNNTVEIVSFISQL